MRIADIIMAVDEPIKATRCTQGSPAGCRSDRSRCMTHDLWEELGTQIYLFLSTITLEDVIENRVLGRAGHAFIMDQTRSQAAAAAE
jgi:Rrf2 family iron-sulfur cluster assembly transcriptional regulator